MLWLALFVTYVIGWAFTGANLMMIDRPREPYMGSNQHKSHLLFAAAWPVVLPVIIWGWVTGRYDGALDQEDDS